MLRTQQLVEQRVPVTRACQAMAIPPSSYYLARQEKKQQPKERVSRSTRALSETERDKMRELLNSERFADQAPRQVFATLLDEGTYHGSVSTMYRILQANDEVRERRNQRRHPTYSKPELLAEGPNQLWSWDITKLKSERRLVYYYLYVMLDVFSRFVVGWMIMERESAALGQELIRQSYQGQGVQADTLTIHSDRGSPMIANTTAQLLQNLGVVKSHSRPHVSNDNPFSEAQFKTLKYRPDFPKAFGSVQDARAWGRKFFAWYNHEHYHTGLQLLTPADVHLGRASEVVVQRNHVLARAYAAHPERFVRGQPVHPQLPSQVWINPPVAETSPTDLAR